MHHKKDKARSLNDQALMRTKEGQRLNGYPLAAGLFATSACLGTLLAVLHVGVFFALVAAGFTEFGALFHHVRGVLGPAGHKADGQGADVGTVPVDADAAGH